ncbi:hypothetical protein PC121_g8712 [Phytophthora cactorum]|nr:hypothetical protein PC120_g6034 [Phytophthora cactorum]KAG3073306.1 hypothetical protein PC121_g8712 [Phytophthora cactorum]
MSFFGYRSSSSRASQQETHLSELERLRGRQLASLVRAGGRAKNQQQTTFEVPVADTPRGSLALQLQLPPEFPVKVPRLKASIPVQHRWLDAAGNVQGHPDLSKWTAHSDLGRIVTEIVTELRVVASSASASKPPVSPAISSSPAPSLLPYPGSRSSHASPSRQSSQAQIQQPKQQTPDTSKMQRTQMPVIPAIFPELEELSLSQLEKLNSDKHALKKFVKELTSVKEFTQLRDEVLYSNMGIANTTLGYETELRELQEVVEAQRVELRAAQQALAEKQARQQRIVARHRPDALLEQLSAAAKDVDNESDEIATHVTCTTSARSNSRECTSTKKGGAAFGKESDKVTELPVLATHGAVLAHGLQRLEPLHEAVHVEGVVCLRQNTYHEKNFLLTKEVTSRSTDCDIYIHNAYLHVCRNGAAIIKVGMSSHRLLLPLLALLSVLLTGLYVADVVSTKNYESTCEMTWSWPVYSPVTWRSVPSHPKYQLYRVDMKFARESLSGVPVLFVPGHLGSYKQARSLSRHLWDTNETLFDLFALDLDEEPTGLNGNFITDQATYLNDVVRAILREYKRQHKKSNKQLVIPDSVVIVAHSMGGIVARTAELLPNYKKRSIQHVVGLGVPYENPSFPFDAEMNAIYDGIHSKKSKDDQVVYVSIAGGHKDTLVQTSLTGVDTVADSSRAFVALASAIPTVQTPVDHFCLLWCHQLLKVVAESLYKAVDLETRELVNNPSVRLAIAKEVLFGGASSEDSAEVETAANVSLHRSYVYDGYYPGEYAGYALLLPQFLTNLLRTRFMTVIVIMYVLALQIFYAQVAQWQTRFNLQSTPSPQDLSQENFPSFTSMLHPAAHAPAFLQKAANALHGRSSLTKPTTMGIAVFILAAAAATGYVGYGQVLYSGQNADSLAAVATIAAEAIFLYAYALGLLFALTKLFSLLQRFVVSPVVLVLGNITDRLKLSRWIIIAVIHVVVQLVGQIKSPSSDSSRVLGLLVLASFVVFVLHLLALGGNNDGTSDQQRMQRSLFTVLFLSVFPWVGKVAYFAGIVRFPPSELSNGLLMEGGSYIAVLSMFTYLISLSLDCMIPLPPTAFFGASSGQDAASVYGKSSNNSGSNVKITAENCPKCIFEDGGPGSVLVEYNDRTTRRVVTGKTGEVVYVGTTFRVVSCDCVYRFKNSRDFCDFCIRSCRLCGGGNGNYQEAAKYKDFLEESKVDLAMHALVPMTFQICAAIQATYGLYRAHMSFYLTPACVLALLIYHIVLRHPIEARRIKNKQRKKTTKKKKSSNKSKSKATSTTETSTTTTSTTVTNDTTSRNKKKKKRKSGTSSTSSTSSASSPLIEEVSTSS